MVLVFPGTDPISKVQLSTRLSWASWRSRWALAPFEDGEPLLHHATEGVLSDAMYNVEAVVLVSDCSAAVPATMTASSKSLFDNVPDGLA
jgi:hypothetical protein